MATMNFSIPDDIKEAFNRTFAKANKSAIVAKLLLDAVEDAKRRQESADAAAMESGGTLVTADGRHFRKAENLGSIILLGQFSGTG